MSSEDRMRVAIAAGYSLRTIDRWIADPTSVHAGTDRGIRAALAQLGIAAPGGVATAEEAAR